MTPSTFTVKNLLDVDSTQPTVKNSLRWAVERANAKPGADTIVFKPGLEGTIPLQRAITIGASVVLDGPGAGKITVDGGRFTEIFFVTDGDVDVISQVTIRDLTLARGETFFGGGAVRNFENLKLRNLVFRDNLAGNGGAIESIGGKLTIADCNFVGNQAIAPDTGGGAIHSTGGDLIATRTRFIGNSALAGHGGAILADHGDVTLRDCVVAGNQASADETAGGGISNSLAPGTGDLTMVRSRVSGNVSGGEGGGIYHGADQSGQGSRLLVKNSTVRGNRALLAGGGIYAVKATVKGSTIADNVVQESIGKGGGGIVVVDGLLIGSTIRGNDAGKASGGGIKGGTVALVNCTISGNRAGDGGGLFVSGAMLTGCTVSGNSATDFATGHGLGGAIFAGPSQLALINSTVSGNTAVNRAGAIYAQHLDLLNVTIVKNFAANTGGVFHSSTSLPATLRNTIVALNRIGPGGSSPDLSGPFESLGHNLIGDSSDHPAFINGVNGDQVGQPGKPLNPRIGPLANNGGSTRTHALLRRSSAIDAGDNNDAPRKDQRGVRRPRDGDGNGSRRFDIGAFER